jgi:SAM-dependent methyltransferase
MATASVNELPIVELLRCVQLGEADGRCRGALIASRDRCSCERCGVDYLRVRGVPVLKPRQGGAADDGWFEGMYEGRDRARELDSGYLKPERDFMADFAARNRLAGPCLEVGCGLGIFAEIMPGFIGLEYSLQSLLASGFEIADRVCADATVMPFADECMECVSSFNTLEHVPNVDRAFAEMDRVLKPGGFLVLKPAWHCTRYTTELIPVLPYRSLTLRQDVVKALLPVLKSRPYKLATRLPWRMWRRATARGAAPLRYGRLTPYHGEAWIADSDAVANLDCHEGIHFYLRRGYACHSHPTAFRQLLAGHDLVVLQKPPVTAGLP